MIPYGKQNITQQDIDAVVEVLNSDFLTQGPKVPAFEKALSDYTGANFALAVNSATSALHIACLSLGLAEGDWLWTSPITFVASANCGLYCGAKIDFVDIDPKTYNLCPDALESKLVTAKKDNCLPKIVVAVHMCGQPCDMKRIHQLSLEYGFSVIEDASHAVGGRYLDEPVGNCRYSDITVFSFHPVKIITTAEGGLALTNDRHLAEKMELFRSHGVTRKPDLMQGGSDGPWYYQQVELGFNYRMTELQAALGLSQFERLDQFVIQRHEIADSYFNLLKDLPLSLPLQNEETFSAFHLFVIRLKLDELNCSHLDVFNSLREQGIGVNLHYIPVHLQPYYKNLGFEKGSYPQAENYYSEAISIPIFHGMSETQMLDVVKALTKALATELSELA